GPRPSASCSTPGSSRSRRSTEQLFERARRRRGLTGEGTVNMPKPSIPACALGSTLLFAGAAYAQAPAAPAPVIVVVPAPAPAQPPVVVVDVAQNAHVVDPDAVRAAIGRELQRPAVAPDEMEARTAQGRLTIALDPDRRIVMIYRDAAGREVLRAVAMPSDPA